MSISVQFEMIGRLVIAAVCGGLIGSERKNRLKEAGIRTHVIVCIGAALIMIISKYGFYDVSNNDITKMDPSRIAAQIVSGVGFLGAGTIFIRGQLINGLTTAAGIWATAGLGMALGAGLYILGICTTLFILVIQIVLHKSFPWNKFPICEALCLKFADDGQSIMDIKKRFNDFGIDIVSAKFERVSDGIMMAEVYIKLSGNKNKMDIMEVFKDASYIQSIDI